MAQTEDGKNIFDGVCEDGRITLNDALLEDGRIIDTVPSTVIESDQGTGIESSGSRLFTASDQGIGTDVLAELSVTLLKSDQGTGVDALSALLNIISKSDQGVGAEVAITGESLTPRGFYYSKLGADNLINPPTEDFSITTELNNIASFNYVVQNNVANRTIITDHLTEDFKIMRDDDTVLLTGSIDSDNIEYFATGDGGRGKRIRLSGHANYVDLAYLLFKRMLSADSENVDSVQDEDNSTSTFTNYTTEANNDTINDVLLTFGAVNDALYLGKNETFFGMKIKYSTKGIQAGSTNVIIEYSKGGGVWGTLDCIDESYAFTGDPGTYLLYIPNKADDWAKDTVNSVTQYWIRFRITQGSYSTLPKLDRIWLSNADVCRIQFNDISAKTILGYILDGTGYNEHATDQCPTDLISIRFEYESLLRCIAGIAKALTWEDGDGNKKQYDWWIDTNKDVHFKQERGTDKGDISADFRALNNKIGYHGVGTRIFGAGGYDGINQKRAITEDITAQGTYALREIVVEDNRITDYATLKDEVQKTLAFRKAPLKEVSGDINTQFWLDQSLSVGDKVTVNQPDWNLNNQELYIVRAQIDPSNTQLDLGTSQMHLEHMRSSLQRQMDINNVWMHGAVSTFVSGPVEENYQRVDVSTVYPVTMKIQIPSNARAINHVEISWVLSNYKSSVKPTTSSGGGHYHTMSNAGWSGGHLHSIPNSGSEGGHNHSGSSSYEGAHQHTIGFEGGHIHTIGTGGGVKTSAASNDWVTGGLITTANARWVREYDDTCSTVLYCDNIWVVKSIQTGQELSTKVHTHTVNIDHAHSESSEPDHSHSENWEVNHDHDLSIGTEPNHNHSVPNANTEPDHDHTVPDSNTESDHDHTTDYGVHEEAGGTTLELYVNDVLVANNYVGNQENINITGWITTGYNTIKLQPIVGDNVKGRAEISSLNTVFLENLK